MVSRSSCRQLNPVLESFDNAKTVRNDNPSRFGKWIQISLNPAFMTLEGASVTDYLLEVTRVCNQGDGERNYHIFYQLMTPMALAEMPYLQLEDASKYKFLKQAPVAMNDEEEFKALLEAFNTLNFNSEKEEHICRIAAGNLHMGKSRDPRAMRGRI